MKPATTEYMKFVMIHGDPGRLLHVLGVLRGHKDVEHKVFRERTSSTEAGLDVGIAGHPVRVESLIMEIRRMGVAVDFI